MNYFKLLANKLTLRPTEQFETLGTTGCRRSSLSAWSIAKNTLNCSVSTALESDSSDAPADPTLASKPLVALTGASGFIGGALAQALRERFVVRGVGRGNAAPTGVAVDAWQRADLFNLKEAEQSLAGADVAIYLVHSMMPSARLTQATFEDLDLICADNFGRAAAKAGVKQIVYLGGLLPAHGELSKHLQSRHEVEHALGLYGTPVTTIRAGLILGGGGSSFEMLVRLVERLPAMACPGWTKTRTQPVAVDDVVKLLAFTAGNAACAGQTYDIGAPDIVTYRELLELVAQQLGVTRKMVPVPFFSPSFSRLWITLVTGASRELVGPLVQSLRHEMTVRDHRLATLANITMTPVHAALATALQQRSLSKQTARSHVAPSASNALATTSTQKNRASLVRSVQRMKLPNDKNAAWAANEYTAWLPHAFWKLLRVEVSAERECRFVLIGMKTPLLVLTYVPDRSTEDRQLFYITGGMLSLPQQRGRFELREVGRTRTLLTAIHDFGPRLPWFIYRYSQAVFHGWVMSAFRRHIAKAGGAAQLGSAA